MFSLTLLCFRVLLLEPINLFIHIKGKVVSFCHTWVLSGTLEVVFVHIFVCMRLVLTLCMHVCVSLLHVFAPK